MPSAVLTHRMPGTADRTDGHRPHSCYDRRSLAPHACRTCVTIGGPERRTAAGLYCRTGEVGHYASAAGKYLQYDPTAGENCRHTPGTARHTPGTARHLCEIWSAVRNISDECASSENLRPPSRGAVGYVFKGSTFPICKGQS
jgi:hypothetical protein